MSIGYKLTLEALEYREGDTLLTREDVSAITGIPVNTLRQTPSWKALEVHIDRGVFYLAREVHALLVLMVKERTQHIVVTRALSGFL
jgi:hypothetical protein